MEKGVQRWIVDISEWNPSPHYFSFAMSFLPHHEHNSITRFFKMEDRKRALVSRLLQYALIHQVLEIPYNEIVIRRTAEGKPYLECDRPNLKLPNFNFNASHHGDFVAIASEPICLVGLDVVTQTIPEKESVEEFIQSFSSYFSRLEWFNIINAGSSHQILSEFYRYWSVKEAFVKAIGDGVGYKLDTIEFDHKNWENIVVKVDGKELKDWRFWLLELGKDHMASIARGHPMYATSSYKTTLSRTQFNDEEYDWGLHLPNASFIFRKKHLRRQPTQSPPEKPSLRQIRAQLWSRRHGPRYRWLCEMHTLPSTCGIIVISACTHEIEILAYNIYNF